MTETSADIVRQELDEILANEIRGFIDLDMDNTKMSFNLGTISCIIIIVEREREIKQYADSPPERFTRETFIEELVEIGLEQDNYLEIAVDFLMDNGYIGQDSNGGLQAELPSFMMVAFLDTMFPGMQGMNLLAFVLQINEEVNSGRKSLELAKESFKSTLKSRGVSVTQDQAQKLATDMVTGVQKRSGQSQKISQELKKHNFNRLANLMKTRKRSDTFTQQMLVQDVFDKGPSKEEIEAQEEAARKEAEIQRRFTELGQQIEEKDEKIQQTLLALEHAETQLEVLEQTRTDLAAAQEQISLLESKLTQIDEKDTQIKELEYRNRRLEEDLTAIRQAAQEEAAKREQEAATAVPAAIDDDDIESKIAQFEEELAIVCPLCNEGKLKSSTTEKGREYYSCSKPDCRFIAWDKPYHFACPLCKNPYLTETTSPEGEKGLKCPRASCSYTQNNLLDPGQSMAAASSSSGEAAEPKKKKRLVRIKKRS